MVQKVISLYDTLSSNGQINGDRSFVHNLAKMAIKHGFQSIQDMLKHSSPDTLKTSNEVNRYCLSITNQSQILIWNLNTGVELAAFKYENLDQITRLIQQFESTHQAKELLKEIIGNLTKNQNDADPTVNQEDYYSGRNDIHL